VNRLRRRAILLRARFDAMDPGRQSSALFHLSLDAAILLFLVAAIYVGATGQAAAFFFWVPFLAVLAWLRFRQARERWTGG
jgi:hypothetical protein